MKPIDEGYKNYVAKINGRGRVPLDFDAWKKRHWGDDENERMKYADLEDFSEVNEMLSRLLTKRENDGAV